MDIKLYNDAKNDLEFWKGSGNKGVQKQIQKLFADMKQHPFEAIGKPEALKHALIGKLSRRINR